MEDTANTPRWPDEITWLSLLKPAIANDAKLADTACRLCYVLAENIKAGPKGIERALSALNLGLRQCFAYTAEYHAGFEHYLALLKGDLRPENEPLNVIAAALKCQDQSQERRRHERAKRKAGANGNLANWVFDAMTLPVTGTYSILVDPDSSFTGSVTFTIYEVPSNVSGTIAIGGSPVTVTTTVPGQNAVLSFSGTAGQQVSLATSNATASGTATLRNTYGTALDSFASAPFNGFVETHTLSVTGTHSVLVDPSGSSTGSVTVRLYDTADVVAPITIGGSSVTATVSSPGQVAKLPFSGTAGQKVSVKMINLTFGLGAIKLLKPDGSLLQSASGLLITDQFFDQTTLPVSGTYTLVLDPENAQTGSATFQVYDVTTDASASATVGGSATTLTITAPGQNGEVTFDATASQQVTVHITSNSIGTMTVTLLKPDGTLVTLSTSSGSFDLAAQTLPVTGTYKIKVDPSGPATGSVNMSVTSP